MRGLTANAALADGPLKLEAGDSECGWSSATDIAVVTGWSQTIADGAGQTNTNWPEIGL